MDFADTSPVALILSLIIGYLSGSVPYGLLLTQMAGLGDVRQIGSGNIGATNVLRTGNKGLAALTLLLDALKGMVPVLLANHFLGLDAAILAGLGAFLGHLYPGLAEIQGRQGRRHLRRHLARLFLARAAFPSRSSGSRWPSSSAIPRSPR
jgi:glycerol-3-phosphate acyltransferase PlsY